MATLESGSNRLSRIERQRNLADALAQQALQGPGAQNFRHPLQGWAMLAQALASGAINRGADQKMAEYQKQRQQALLDALQPVQEPVVQQFEKIEGTMPDGSPIPAIPNQTFKQPGGGVASYPRDKTMEELITSLPPDLAEPAIMAGIEARMRSQYDTQKDRYQKVGDYDVSGLGLESVPIHRDRQTHQLGLLEATGFRPLSASEMTEVQRQAEVSPSVRLKQLEPYQQADVALDQFKRLRELVAAGGFTEETFVGNVRKVGNEVANAFKGLGMTLNVMVNGQEALDEGQLLRESSYKTLDITDQDRQKYDISTIAANQEFLGEFAKLDAATQQISIAIAYTLARIADPGGRLSEMDVMNQVRSLGLHRMSRAARLSALGEAEKTFAKTVKSMYDFQAANGLAPELPPGFMSRMDEILNRPTTRPPPTVEEAARYINSLRTREEIEAYLNTLPPEIRQDPRINL